MEPNHKELLIGLLGSTYGELKRLDDSIIGSSSTLNRRSENVKQELTNVLRGVAAKPDVPILQAIQPPQAVPFNPPVQPTIPPPPQVVFTPPAVAPQSIQTAQPVVKPDDGQLEFDLNKTAKYDDIINEIDRITAKIGKLEDKIDTIIKIISEQKKKVG